MNELNNKKEDEISPPQGDSGASACSTASDKTGWNDEDNLEMMNSAISRYQQAFYPNLVAKQGWIEQEIGIPLTKYQVLLITQWAVGHPFGVFTEDRKADWVDTVEKFMVQFGNPKFEE